MGPHDGVEVGYPSEWEDRLLPFTDNNTDRTPEICGVAPTLYVNVPPHVISAIIRKHAGLRHDSGELPPMVDMDANGSLWAAAAEPPSESEESEVEVEGYGSPSSAVHMGAASPLPPPIPHGPPTPMTPTTAATDIRVGALTPPQTLTDAGLSPIER